MPAHVIIDDLHKRYGGVEAVHGISFEIRAGEIYGLLGPNGAGKTTTLECVAGLRSQDRGKITIGGLDAGLNRREVQEKIGVVLQSTALPDQITAREALSHFGSFYRRRLAPSALLKRFDLTAFAEVPYFTLSGGQRQRLALALAFVNHPEVVVLDEPTSGLDPKSRHDLNTEIRRLKQEGCAVLLSTHQLEEAEQLCDRLAIIDRGRVVASGDLSELVARMDTAQTVTLIAAKALDVTLLAEVEGVKDLHCEGAVAHFRTGDAAKLIVTLGAWCAANQIEVRELHVRKASLEELFLQLTRASDQGDPRRH